ncbi:MAG: serine hydrolase [Ilumatobacter sp.]|nr:serine hydrolase [Ilumatobacter sp.]
MTLRIGIPAAAFALFAGMVGCGEPGGQFSRRDNALEKSIAELRISLGEQWGEPIPGLSAAVLTNGDARVAASGSANPPGSIKLRSNDRFHIGSITKTFTAALIMQLDQERLLSLEQPISRWFDYPNGDLITVAMLLGHTSGVADFSESSSYTPTDSPERSVQIAATLDPVFDPGADWSYSNTNYILLGLITEQVTGASWASEVASRFLKPLGLMDTYVWTGQPHGSTVQGSRLSCSGPEEPACNPPQFDLDVLPIADGHDWTVAWAAGAMVSTPHDVARWLRALVRGDVLDEEHRLLMTTATPQSVKARALAPPFGTLRWTGNGLGLFRYEVESEGIGWGHEGLINGFAANAIQMSERDLTVSILSNFQMTDSFTALGEIVAITQ